MAHVYVFGVRIPTYSRERIGTCSEHCPLTAVLHCVCYLHGTFMETCRRVPQQHAATTRIVSRFGHIEMTWLNVFVNATLKHFISNDKKHKEICHVHSASSIVSICINDPFHDKPNKGSNFNVCVMVICMSQQ